MIEDTLYQVTKSMRRASRFQAIYPHPDRNCTWDCEMRDLCLQYFTAGDVEFFKQTYYKQAAERG